MAKSLQLRRFLEKKKNNNVSSFNVMSISIGNKPSRLYLCNCLRKKVTIPGQSGGKYGGMIARASFSCNIIYMKKITIVC